MTYTRTYKSLREALRTYELVEHQYQEISLHKDKYGWMVKFGDLDGEQQSFTRGLLRGIDMATNSDKTP